MDIDLEKVKEIANRYNIEVEVEVVPNICKLLEVEVEEPFNIKGIACNPCKVQKNTYYVVDKNNDVLHAKHLLRAINDTSIVEKIKYTDEQKEIFKALKVLGFTHIGNDDWTDGDNIWAFTTEPYREDYCWCFADDDEVNEYIRLRHIKNKFNFIKRGELFEIPEEI